MTTTPEVPMPEPDRGTIRVGREDISLGHSDEAMRAYADARCAQESSALLGLIADIRVAAGDPTGKLDWPGLVDHVAKLQAERDEAWAAYHNRQEAAIRLKCEADAAKLERDALAEKVKAMEDNDRPARELKNGEVLVEVHGLTGSGKSAVAGEIEILCKALGLQVQWENGDEEKFLTHADWTAALELYNPRVRIVEVNTPRPEIQGTSAAIDAAGDQP